MTDLISRLRDLHMQCDGLSLYAEAADEIGRLTKKLEATQSNLCSLQCFFEDWKVAHSTVQKDVEIERLRADAERYRWLEEHCTSENDNGDKCLVFWCDFENYNDVDAAIDAARAALKEPT